MKYLKVAAFSSLVLLAGCTTISNQWSLGKLFSFGHSNEEIQGMDAQKLFQVPGPDLCAAYAGTHSPVIHKEIQRRSYVDSWSRVNSGKTWTGMNLCSLLASQGKPDSVSTFSGLMVLEYTNNHMTYELQPQSGSSKHINYHVRKIEH